MHTDTYETVSEFKSIETVYAGDAVARQPVLSGLRPLIPELVIFPKKSADRQKVRVNRVSRMKDRLTAKSELLFAPAIDARLKIHTPFQVRIAGSAEGVSAHAEEIEEFGYGSNRGEALDDLGKTIAELYFALESKREKLSSDLERVLKSLEKHITRVHR